MNNDIDYVRGSYIFNNCNELSSIVDENTIASYQPYTYKESGFAVQNANGGVDNNYKWTQGGKVSLDSTELYSGKSTERLESISNKYPLRSSTKLIPVAPSSTLNGINIVYKTPVGYTSGASLIVAKNAALGIKNDTKMGDITSSSGEWNTATFSLSAFRNPVWTQKSFIEVYVELLGESKQLNIAKWQISTL
jgi:hypothetical protein